MLSLMASGIAGQAPARPDNSVTGDDYRDGISRDCTSNGLRGHARKTAQFCKLHCKLAIASRFPIGDAEQKCPYVLLKLRPDKVERDRDTRIMPLKVHLKPAPRAAQDLRVRLAAVRSERAREIPLSVKPQACQAYIVGGKQYRPQGRGV